MTAPAWQVVIVGAGPVGLLLGNLLGDRDIRTLLVDRRPTPPAASMAIGLTPPSLAVLGTLDLDQSLISAGIRVDRAVVHGDRGPLGNLSFRTLPAPYPFILAVPQAETVRQLERRLASLPTVTLRRGTELVDLEQDATGVSLTLHREGTTVPQVERCRFLVGADGGKSRVRQLAGISAHCGAYVQTFSMADFADHSGFGAEAHLFFTRHGSVESFPLPGGYRRWVVQTGAATPVAQPDAVATAVLDRTGVDLAGCARLYASAYTVGWLLADRYHHGRVALCGDAAHLMSPVGGQGMNVGFADAAWLAALLPAALGREAAAASLLDRYGNSRRAAARTAIGRAARGMWLGTRRGRLAGYWRDPLLRLLLAPPLCQQLPAYFAMLTLPYTSPTLVPASR